MSFLAGFLNDSESLVRRNIHFTGIWCQIFDASSFHAQNIHTSVWTIVCLWVSRKSNWYMELISVLDTLTHYSQARQKLFVKPDRNMKACNATMHLRLVHKNLNLFYFPWSQLFLIPKVSFDFSKNCVCWHFKAKNDNKFHGFIV